MKEKIKWFFHCLLVSREYSKVGDTLYIREWWGKPKPLMQHLKEDHRLCQAEINDLILEARRIVRKQGGG